MAQTKTQTRQYWVEDFKVDQSDLDHLYSVLLEQESPLSSEEMAFILVRHRVERDAVSRTVQRGTRDHYHPTELYRVGDKLDFPSLGFATGEVTGSRPGNNSAYGDYSVLKVKFSGNEMLEFASGVAPEHLRMADEEPDTEEVTEPLSSEQLFIEYGGVVAEAIERSLASHEDLVRLAGRWFPKSLLANINSGHLNLAEAVLDMHAGGPLTTTGIIDEANMLQNVSEHLAEFSLNYALQQDTRFDEVGPAGQVLWYLTRLEPPEVQTPPPRLAYTEIPSDPTLLTQDLREVEQAIGDEHSDLQPRVGQPQSATVTLIYPHRRAGTLPLSPTLRTMFPTAYESPRVRFTLVDEATEEEYPAWVVRPWGYVFGLLQFFDQHEIPVGAQLTVKRTQNPGRVLISASVRKPRKEWVRTAVVEGNRLRFENLQRPISVAYDELMSIDVPDPEAVDGVWKRVEDRRIQLDQVMGDVMKELAVHSPQGHVHAKTIYSAVNLIKRSPPGPIFARLVALPEFEHVGGPYWRLGSATAEN